ncbi:5-formyltetrahydrofolate cyclo-ligase [Heyndrickxia acidiproducens]|jgi:5-formyltetrahydrofolate cyclo-ligase|uniref:5-formyltetrahydrofolate cyclo-ligase n=1 Tax=Heyndrickxia acidiproducens TaxID=1121084 RepID=UPI00036B65F1|nr:5-formyltetrahydrofolate cyclo-ligase [Heyndrickxia acidiproducens]
MPAEKNQLRKQIKAMLSEMPRSEYESRSLALAGRLFASSAWQEADTVALTIPRFPEVDTIPMIKRGWGEGKRICVPKCIPAPKQLVFRELRSFDELETVYFGLSEPIVEKTEEVAKDEIDLMVVPGLGYTKNGFRLGYGGGYYDRYLADFAGETVALAFKEQMIADFAVESHDIPIGSIVTEK